MNNVYIIQRCLICITLIQSLSILASDSIRQTNTMMMSSINNFNLYSFRENKFIKPHYVRSLNYINSIVENNKKMENNEKINIFLLRSKDDYIKLFDNNHRNKIVIFENQPLFGNSDLFPEQNIFKSLLYQYIQQTLLPNLMANPLNQYENYFSIDNSQMDFSIKNWFAQSFAYQQISQVLKHHKHNGLLLSQLEQATKEGLLPRFHEITDSHHILPNLNNSILLGSFFIDWLIKKFSDAKLYQFSSIVNQAHEQTLNAVFKQFFHHDLSNLYHEFIAFFTYQVISDSQQTHIDQNELVKLWFNNENQIESYSISPNKALLAVNSIESEYGTKTPRLIVYSTQGATNATTSYLTNNTLSVNNTKPIINSLSGIDHGKINDIKWLNDHVIIYNASIVNEFGQFENQLFKWNISTDNIKKLNNTTHFQKFDINRYTNTIIAEKSSAGVSYLVQYNINSAKQNRLLPLNQEASYRNPKFSKNTRKISFLKKIKTRPWKISVLNLENNKENIINIPPTIQNIIDPYWLDDQTLCFSSYNGKSFIFRSININNGNITTLFNSQHYARNIYFLDKNNFIFLSQKYNKNHIYKSNRLNRYIVSNKNNNTESVFVNPVKKVSLVSIPATEKKSNLLQDIIFSSQHKNKPFYKQKSVSSSGYSKEQFQYVDTQQLTSDQNIIADSKMRSNYKIDLTSLDEHYPQNINSLRREQPPQRQNSSPNRDTVYHNDGQKKHRQELQHNRSFLEDHHRLSDQNHHQNPVDYQHSTESGYPSNQSYKNGTYQSQRGYSRQPEYYENNYQENYYRSSPDERRQNQINRPYSTDNVNANQYDQRYPQQRPYPQQQFQQGSYPTENNRPVNSRQPNQYNQGYRNRPQATTIEPSSIQDEADQLISEVDSLESISEEDIFQSNDDNNMNPSFQNPYANQNNSNLREEDIHSQIDRHPYHHFERTQTKPHSQQYKNRFNRVENSTYDSQRIQPQRLREHSRSYQPSYRQNNQYQDNYNGPHSQKNQMPRSYSDEDNRQRLQRNDDQQPTHQYYRPQSKLFQPDNNQHQRTESRVPDLMSSTHLNQLPPMSWLDESIATTHQVENNCWHQAGKQFNLDPWLLYSIAQVESNLDPKAINQNKNSEDVGLMQINSFWFKALKNQGIDRNDLFKPCINIKVGAWVLAHSIDSMGNNWQAIGAYNAGTSKQAKFKRIRERYAQKVLTQYRTTLNQYNKNNDLSALQ